MGSKEDIMKMEYENYYCNKNAQFQHSKRNKTNVDGSYTIESSAGSTGDWAEGSHSHLPERDRPMGQKSLKGRGKKKASDEDEEMLSTAAKHIHEISNVFGIITGYDIMTRDTSAMESEPLKNHNMFVAYLKKKLGM